MDLIQMSYLKLKELPDLFEEVRELIQQGIYSLWRKPEEDDVQYVQYVQYVLHVPEGHACCGEPHAEKFYGLDSEGNVITELLKEDVNLKDLTLVLLTDDPVKLHG